MNIEINIEKDIINLAEKIADRFHELVSGLDWQDKISVALAGGATPAPFYDELANKYKEIIPWSKIHVFWGDERCVPYNHHESNFNMAKKILLDKINIPVGNIHRIIGENKPELEEKRYSSELQKHVPFHNEFPRFDIMILGIGEDGHTASIFSKNMELMNVKSFCALARHPKSGQQRITLTGNVINNSKNILILAKGKNKSNIVKSIIKKENKDKFPAAHVDPMDGKLVFFLDQDAAADIS